MLLDPRAYRKRAQKNGNEQDLSPASPDPGRSAATSWGSYNEFGFFTSPSQMRCPSPPEDPICSDSERSFLQVPEQQDPEPPHTGASSTPTIAPPGTASAAHRLLSPPKRRSSRKPSPKSQIRSPSGRSSSRNSRIVSPQRTAQAMPVVDVEFASSNDLEDGSDAKRGSSQVDGDIGTRHGSLIENMYGVERRAHPVYKKLKTEKDLGETPAQTNREFSATGNTDLGKWMKEDQSKPDSPIPSSDVVDLTLGMEHTQCAAN